VNSPLTRLVFFFGITAAILPTITFLSTKDSQAMLTPWEVEWGVKHSKLIVIGEVQSVETKLVDESFTISDGYHEQWLPYQYVTLKVEKYILDKTRQHSDTIIFRDRAEGEGTLDGKTLYSNEDPVGRYEIGKRSLFFIAESKEELFSGGFQNKFDFVNEDKVQSKYFEMDEREPISLSKFEEEIANAITAFSPKAQTASGFFPEDVRCKDGLQLIFKSKDNSPACVKWETSKKLIERGWGTTNLRVNSNTEPKFWVILYPISCHDDICYINWLKEYYDSTTYQPKRIKTLIGYDFEQNVEFIKSYFEKQGTAIFDAKHNLANRVLCQPNDCWDRHELYLLTSDIHIKFSDDGGLAFRNNLASAIASNQLVDDTIKKVNWKFKALPEGAFSCSWQGCPVSDYHEKCGRGILVKEDGTIALNTDGHNLKDGSVTVDLSSCLNSHQENK
jgi:hypothetical protein